MTAKTKYEYPEGVDVISGFGADSGYEKTCQAMVIAGLEWCDNHPKAKLSWKEYKNVYGITFGESDDLKEMQEVMLKASGDDCTGAMMQACTNHIVYAKKNGWDKYLDELEKSRNTDENT